MTLHVAVAGWLLGPPSGANRRLLALLQHTGTLLAAGERITVLHAADFAPPPLANVHWQPIAIPRAPTWRRVLAERRLLPATLRALGATVFDHGFLPLPRVAVPTSLVVHDLRAVDGLTRWPRWLARGALRTALTRAAMTFAPSHWTATRLAAIAPGAAIAVVPNAADPAPAAAAPPARALPPHGYLLHVGHLEPRKNLGVLLAALRTLPRAQRPELWLAGRDAGALRTLLARAGDLGVAALGEVADAELGRLYQHARAVVVPSVHEGFGLPALEGLAHGRPVLVSAAGALPEVVGDAGTCLAPHDANAWAAAIAATAATGDPAPRRARAAAFSWAASAAVQIAAWRQIGARAR